VERAFATLFGKTRSIASMLNAARNTIPLRKGLWETCKEKDQQSAAEMV
jgi:hypothetical protein